MFNKIIAKHYILTIITGALLIFHDLIKLLIKGSGSIDIIDMLAATIIFTVFIILVIIIKKTYYKA